MENQPPEVLMRGLLRAYYWMDESLQNGLQRAGYRPRTRTQTMILINISNGITRAAELARVLGVSRQAIQQQINDLEQDDIVTQIPDPGRPACKPHRVQRARLQADQRSARKSAPKRANARHASGLRVGKPTAQRADGRLGSGDRRATCTRKKAQRDQPVPTQPTAVGHRNHRPANRAHR